MLGICRDAEREPLTKDWKETVSLRTSRQLDYKLFIPGPSTLPEAEPVDPTDVESVDPTDVEPVDPTDVELVDPTDVERVVERPVRS